MKHIFFKGAFILTGLLSFNLFAQSKAPLLLDELFPQVAQAKAILDLDAQAANETYVCAKEDSNPTIFQLFKPGRENDSRLCELKITTVSGATVTAITWPQEFQFSNSTWVAKYTEDSCEEKLADSFLREIRAGYLCGN